MRRRPTAWIAAFAATATAALLTGTASPAQAITSGGTPDGDAHPYVGALWYGDRSDWLCTGSLISPTVFVTAAHCTVGLTDVFVSFESDITDPSTATLLPGKAYTHPQFLAGPYAADVGVVVLNKRVKASRLGELPALGAAESQLGQPVTSVGYGSLEQSRVPHEPKFAGYGLRSYAVGTLQHANGTWLFQSQNAAKGDEGTCYGDSGGPNLQYGTDVILAVTSTGDGPCYATGRNQRLDTDLAQSFIRPFLG